MSTKSGHLPDVFRSVSGSSFEYALFQMVMDSTRFGTSCGVVIYFGFPQGNMKILLIKILTFSIVEAYFTCVKLDIPLFSC